MRIAAPSSATADTFRLGIAGRRLDRHQSAHGMAHQAGPPQFERRERRQPICQRIDGQRRATAATMTGQIDRRHAVSVMREIARLLSPDAVVHPGTVQKHNGRLFDIEGLAAGLDIDAFAVDGDLHQGAAFIAALQGAVEIAQQIVRILQARPKSGSGPLLMPASASCAALIC